MRELQDYERTVLERGVAIREMTETRGWAIFKAEIEKEIELSQAELAETLLVEENLGKPKSISLAATAQAYKRLLQSVTNTMENYTKLSNKLVEEQK